MAVVTIYSCTSCGQELGRGPMTVIGSPFVKCQCGKETLVPNRNEWDLMKPSTQSELRSGPYWIGFGASLPISFAGFAIWAGLAGHKVEKVVVTMWYLPLAIYEMVAILLYIVFSRELENSIRESKERMKDEGHKVRVEKWLETLPEYGRDYM